MRSSPRSVRRPAEIGLASVTVIAVASVVIGALAARSASGSDAAPSAAAVSASPSLVSPVADPDEPTPPTAAGAPDASARRSLDGAMSSDPDEWNELAVSADVAGTVADHRIVIDTTAARQSWDGVGAALTDAAASLLADRPDAVARLFAEPDDGGAGLDLVRLPLSSTDFSTRDWTWVRADDGQVVPSPEAEAALEVLDAIESIRPDVGVLAASWTAPAAMRTQPDDRGGFLRDDAVGAYGDLLVDQVSTLLSRGVDLRAVSVGNEPGHVADYPTLGMTDDQMVAIAERIAPSLDAADVDLLALDHNWADADRAAVLLERGPFDSVAFHCYAGEPASMTQVPAAIVTECTATTGGWRTSVGWMARELVGESIRAGSTGLVTWNLALDPQHGPKADGGCGTCRGLVTIDPARGSIETTPEYAVMRHLSAAADPGATVVETPRVDSLPLAAFVNPDGSVGLFGHNDSDDRVQVDVVIDGEMLRYEIAPWTVFSLRG